MSFDATGSTYEDTLLWTFNGTTPTYSNNVTESKTFNSVGTYTCYLEVLGGGCGTYAVDSVVINVVSGPTVTANASSTSICPGDPVTLTGGGATTYSWNKGVTDGVAFNPTTTDTYTVTGTTGSCSNTAQVTVTVKPTPTVTANATSTSICAGDPVTLTGGGANTYSWNKGVTDGVAFNPSSTDTYTVTGTTNGCSNTAQVTVTVKPVPTVTASTTSSSICAGDPVTLTGGGANTYSWNKGVTDGVAFNPTSTDTYTVTGTANGCSNTAQVTVTVKPTPTVTANTTSTSICAGDPVTLTGGGANTYSWNKGVTDGVAFNPSTTDTYTVTGITNGCSNTAQVTVTVSTTLPVTANATSTSICSGDPVTLTGSGATTYSWNKGVTDGVAFNPTSTDTYTVTGTSGSCSNTDQITITVKPKPTVTANVTATSICSGDQVTFTGSGANSYSWDKGVNDGTPFTPSTTDTYTVTGTTNGCSNTDQVTVTVKTVDVTTSTSGNTITANATPASYVWVDCNNGNTAIPGETNQSFTPTTNGDYAVTVTQNGCTETSACVNIIILGVNQSVSSSLINIYPNPTNRNITVDFGQVTTNSITLSDVQGKLVYSSAVNDKTQVTIDLSQFSKGVYFLQVLSDDDVKTYKVIRQ